MKNIGILTMHRVINFGSVLQAYATQHIIDKLGFHAEIIDYQYPNEIHNQDSVSLVTKISRIILQILQGFPGSKQREGFAEFRKKYLHTGKIYPSRESLINDCPEYDTYLVGSDQTWNVRHIGDDDTFFLSFVPDGRKRMSFSSSAARKDLPPRYKDRFKYNLNKFESISVREANTQTLVKYLIGRAAPITLDPTLLLSSEEWGRIANTSKIKDRIKGPFILAYILKYSFDPYPLATEVIRHVHKQYNLPVVCIRYSSKEKLGIDGAIQLNEGISPEDFLWLFKNARFVISTSFHGTAFSLVFNRPFYSIVNPQIEDDRIGSLLSILGANDRAIATSEDLYKVNVREQKDIQQKLDVLRKQSIEYLKDNL